jgi:hypothetical protein
MSYEPRDYLGRILIEADYLVGRSANLTGEAFMADEKLHRAFSRPELRTGPLVAVLQEALTRRTVAGA